MSLQDIQLTSLIINELYRDLLVDISDSGAPTPSRAVKTPSIPEPGHQPQTGYQPMQEPVAPAHTLKPSGARPEPVASAKNDQAAAALSSEVQADGVAQSAMPNTAPASDSLTGPETSGSRIKFLGGNKKRIAFIVNCATDVYLPDAHLDWLKKMLEACHLNLGDVAIANIARNSFSINDIKQELFSTTVILLGTEPAAIQLPLNFPHFNLQQHDNIVFLATPSPDQLNRSTTEAKLLKSKLWVCLQKLFKL